MKMKQWVQSPCSSSVCLLIESHCKNLSIHQTAYYHEHPLFLFVPHLIHLFYFLGLADRFEEYPKLKELIRLKVFFKNGKNIHLFGIGLIKSCILLKKL